jgi:hypothetical protein
MHWAGRSTLELHNLGIFVWFDCVVVQGKVLFGNLVGHVIGNQMD